MCKQKSLFLKSFILSASLGIFISGCGSDVEMESKASRSTTVGGNTVSNTTVFRSNPLSYLAWDRDALKEDLINQVTRQISLNDFEGHIPSRTSQAGAVTDMVATGMGFELKDRYNRPLKFKLGIWARAFDGQKFGERRFFADSQGQTYENPQSIVLKSDLTTTAISGLGITLWEGTISNFKLIQKPLSQVNMSIYSGTVPAGGIVLPPGWVMVGFVVKFYANPPLAPNYPVRIPYISDAVVYTATLGK